MSTKNYDSAEHLEFRDEVHDRIGLIQNTLEKLRTAQLTQTDATTILRKTAQALKGCGASYGHGIFQHVAQRLEQYLEGIEGLGGRAYDDIIAYTDCLNKLAENNNQPNPEEAAEIVRLLPTRYEFNERDVEVRRVEIMLVTPSKVVAKKVSDELLACGYRPLVLHDPIEALATALRVKPQMVIVSPVMEPLSGIDLLRALRSISTTQDLPLAVLTSSDADNKLAVPDKAAIIHVSSFGDDFAAAVAHFALA